MEKYYIAVLDPRNSQLRGFIMHGQVFAHTLNIGLAQWFDNRTEAVIAANKLCLCDKLCTYKAWQVCANP